MGFAWLLRAESFLSKSSIQIFGGQNLDAEAGEANIGQLGRGEQPDRGNAEVLQNLRAETDLAPLARARHLGAGRTALRDGVSRHARRAVTQEDEDTAALLLEAAQRRMHR